MGRRLRFFGIHLVAIVSLVSCASEGGREGTHSSPPAGQTRGVPQADGEEAGTPTFPLSEGAGGDSTPVERVGPHADDPAGRLLWVWEGKEGLTVRGVAVDDERVYAASHARTITRAAGGTISVSYTDCYVRAHALPDGEVLWEREFDDAAQIPLTAGDLLVVGVRNGLHVIDPGNGEPIRSRTEDLGSVWEPTLVGDEIFYWGTGAAPPPPGSARIGRIRPADGEVIWEEDVEGHAHSPAKLAVADGRIFGHTYGGVAFAVSAADGSTLWTRRLGPTFVSPDVAGERVVFRTNRGSIDCLSVAEGSPIWRRTLPGGAPREGGNVRIAGGLALIPEGNGRLYALSIEDGSTVWEYFTGGGFLMGTPVVVGDRVYFTNTQAGVFCVDLTDGSEVWRWRIPPGMATDRQQGWFADPVAVRGGRLYASAGRRLFCLHAE